MESNVGGLSGAPKAALALPVALIVLALAYWCVDTTSPALAVIRDDLGISATGAGLIVSLFFGGRLVANLPAALMVDRSGPGWTAAMGAMLLGGGSAMAALAPGETLLLPARVLQGAGVAFLATAGLLSVLRLMPGSGSAMTAFNVSAGIGGSVGLMAGGYLTGLFSWRAIFWQCAALSVVMFVGSVISGIRGVSVALKGGGERLPPPEETPGMSTFSQPVLGAMAANLLVFIDYGIWVVALPLYAAEMFGAGPTDIGNLLLVINIVHIAGAFPAGGIIRRAGAMRSLGIGLLILTIGMTGMVGAPNPWVFVVPASLYAIGEVAGNSSAGELLLRLGGGGGRAVGMVRITSDIGMVIGPLVCGMVVDHFGVRAPFLALAALTLVGAILALLAARARHPAIPFG